MTSIIISIILNVVLGNPADANKEQDKNTTTTTNTTTPTPEKKDDTINLMGGSGTWTTIEK